METPLSITQLVRRMRNVLEVQVGEIWVEGEVSNLRKQRSGHWYFSLKDEGAQISSVMWSAARNRYSQALEDGNKVKVYGEVTLYEARGQAQLIAREVEAAGLGDLQARFESLKLQLQAEGLFDASQKKPLPKLPQTIGLITSQTGAALQDMMNVLSRRAPWLKVYLYPVQVQGKGAERGIARAIKQMSQASEHGLPLCDLLILARGGGSLEDLWNFNEEIVARAIATSQLPIVSAIGHEIDFTIADFVADMRAPTPSAAAEQVVPDVQDLRAGLENIAQRLQKNLHRKIQSHEALMRQMALRAAAYEPERWLRMKEQELDDLTERLERTLTQTLQQRQTSLQEYAGRWARLNPEAHLQLKEERLLDWQERSRRALEVKISRSEEALLQASKLVNSLGPQGVLERGYSITMDEAGQIVRDPASLSDGQILTTQLAKGKIKSKLTKEK